MAANRKPTASSIPAKPKVVAEGKDAKQPAMVDAKCSKSDLFPPLENEVYLSSFYDPIDCELFKNPVITDAKNPDHASTWEAESLKNFLKKQGGDVDPSHVPLASKKVIPNTQVKDILKEYKEKIVPRLKRLQDLENDMVDAKKQKDIFEKTLSQQTEEMKRLLGGIEELSTRAKEADFYKQKYLDLKGSVEQFFSAQTAAKESKKVLLEVLRGDEPFNEVPNLQPPMVAPAQHKESHQNSQPPSQYKQPLSNPQSQQKQPQDKDYKNPARVNQMSFMSKNNLNAQFLAMVQNCHFEPSPQTKLEYFLRNGVDINTKDPKSGKTALMFLVEMRPKYPAIVGPLLLKLLNEKNIKINTADNNGHTPLILASRANDNQTVEDLLRFGTVDVVNNLAEAMLTNHGNEAEMFSRSPRHGKFF